MSHAGREEGKYTTGEIANFCGVTVRTAQDDDTRGFLVPTELTEGGRRRPGRPIFHAPKKLLIKPRALIRRMEASGCSLTGSVSPASAP